MSRAEKEGTRYFIEIDLDSLEIVRVVLFTTRTFGHKRL